MKKVLFPLLVCFVFTAFPCFAADNPKLDTLLQEIQSRVASTKTVQAAFQQERHLSIFSQPVLFEGKLALSRPENLRWEIITPIPSVLIFSGDKGLRCSGDMEPQHFDLKNDPVMRMVAEQLWTWADGAYGKLKNEYDITLSSAHEIKLQPKNEAMQRAIKAIQVVFDPVNLQPTLVKVLESAGDALIIRFHDYLLNQPVQTDLFTTCQPQSHKK